MDFNVHENLHLEDFKQVVRDPNMRLLVAYIIFDI